MRSGGNSQQSPEPKGLRAIVNAWLDRVLGAVSSGSLAGQESHYAPHETTRDYIWNTAGVGLWGMIFPLLTIVITQILDAGQAGMFSLAFVTGNLLLIVANYGVRAFQVSDVDEDQTFSEYQAARIITCALMLLAGFLYCRVRGYTGSMSSMVLAIFAYRAVDGFADVYEGRLQQRDKLYLAGISQLARSAASLIAFTASLLVTRDLAVSSIAMAVANGTALLVVTFPLAMLETPRSRGLRTDAVVGLLRQCTPLFVALFLYTFIDSMPKFMMDGVLANESQLYFNALCFPAQAVVIIAGFIYKPLIVRMADLWADRTRRGRFDLLICGIIAVVAVLTCAGIALMAWVGIPLMGLMYGLDFGPYTQMSFIMLIAGGAAATADFLYQVITVVRRQREAMRMYLIGAGCAVAATFALIHMMQLQGAVVSYLLIMAILTLLLLYEYISARRAA